MRIVVFGAAGGVGGHAVRHAASAGHEVTAFVRDVAKLKHQEGVRVVQGDAFDADAVASAIAGQDAVISALSSSTGLRRSDELARMAANIVAGMRSADVDRIAYCASSGVDGELTGIAGRAVQWMLRHPLADHRAALDLIAAAGIDVTVARPTSLADGEYAPYAETFTGAPPLGRPIPRASVADFLVRSLEQPETYSRSSVGLAPIGA